MSDEIKKFFSTYTDFVTKVTSEPSIDLDALKKSFDEIEENSGIKTPRLLTAALGLCLLYTSPSPRDGLLSRMPSSA